MPWYEKDHPTPFDEAPIPGLSYLHGDVAAHMYAQDWVRGKKYPLITFPSGADRELTLDRGTERIHLFHALSVSRNGPYEDAVRQLRADGKELGLSIFDDGEGTIIVSNPETHRSYGLLFDAETRELTDVVPVRREAMELLPGHLRAVLPPLYSQEKKELKAIAPIKFFTPDANWTWYPTEFDGANLFFGLVSGYEVELGYFSLTELESVRGLFGLPIERDLYFEPTTLADLQARHRRERYE